MADNPEEDIFLEKIRLKGSQLKEQILALIAEGAARRVLVQKDGKTLLEIPLTVGVGGAAAAILIHAPLTAIGAIVALATDVQVVIERESHLSQSNVLGPDQSGVSTDD